MTVILLGPQRFRPSLRNTVRSLDVSGPIATVTAGWREREPDDAELDGLLDGRSVNLALYGRWLDVQENEPQLAEADRKREEVLDELHSVYVLRLHHAIRAVQELLVRDVRANVAATVVDDAIAAVRALDDRHVELLGEVHDEFADRWRPHERDSVVRHRDDVGRILGGVGALAIAGGHVDVLAQCLQRFDVAAHVGSRPVVGWSAGAMVLTDRIVLFNDVAPDGREYAEVFDSGLGLCHGVVVLPHARLRLRLDDPARVMLFARRFAPMTCVLLDDGVRLDCGDRQSLASMRVLTPDGRVETLTEAVT